MFLKHQQTLKGMLASLQRKKTQAPSLYSLHPDQARLALLTNLSLRPIPHLVACSQAIWVRGEGVEPPSGKLSTAPPPPPTHLSLSGTKQNTTDKIF